MAFQDVSHLSAAERVAHDRLGDLSIHVRLADGGPNAPLRGGALRAMAFQAGPGAPPAVAPSGATATTLGWDTVFAIRTSDANAVIRAERSSPPGFSQNAPDGSGSVTASFGDWQISGGDGVDIHLDLPITSGSVTVLGKKTDISGAVATIEVQFDYLPPPPQSGTSATPSHHDLVPKLTPAPGVKVVSVLKVALAGAKRDLLTSGMVRLLLELWLNTNLKTFQHTFSVVELNRKLAKEDYPWMAPTTTAYAYKNGGTPETSCLAILCLTEGRDRSGLAAQVSDRAIPAGSRAGFLISDRRFLENMVLPALPSVFPGSAATDFDMSGDGTKVICKRPVKMKPVKDDSGTSYQPLIETLEISVQGDQIIVYSVSSTDVGSGSTLEVSSTSFQRLKLATKPDGSKTFIYEEAAAPINDHHVKTSAAGTALKIVLAIVGVILMLILAALTDGAALVVGVLIVGLLVGLAEAAPNLIANALAGKVTDESPSTALLVSNATDPVVWKGGSAFALDFAGLSQSLQLGGTAILTH